MTSPINKILQRTALIVCPVLLLLSSGCKKFLNVNQDPNHLVAAQPVQLLPTVEAAVGVSLGDDFYPYGNIWSQYYTQSAIASQYKAIDQYLQVNADFNYAWQHLYQSALINDQLMLGSTTGNAALVQYQAIGDILKAYTLQLATDAFGDIPMTQALQGSANKSPTYDAQQIVYDTIFALIQKGKALMDDTDPNAPGEDDLIFSGDMDSWTAFANTLELRAYMRLTQIDPATAQAGIQALYATNPTFLTADAAMTYTSTGGNQNPFYIKEVSLGKTVNLAASQTVISAFIANNDPRQFALFQLVKPTDDTITYLPQGSFAQFINKVTSKPAPMTAGDPQSAGSALAPVILISAAESYFLQAEAVARGWASGTAGTLFTQGINASFATDGIPGSAAAYIASAPDAVFPAAPADQIKAIITQKYYAMCGTQGFEAWNEWRRTGFPDFLMTSAAAGGRAVPLRFIYPESELTGNLHYPGTVPETTPVWWDK
jgi:hypothetical protein